jgi:hypothetical protein
VSRGPHPPGTDVVSRASGYWSSAKTARFGPIGMEQLWNRGGATGGKRSAGQKPEGFQNHVHAAARWYSWMSPPSRSWRFWRRRGQRALDLLVPVAAPAAPVPLPGMAMPERSIKRRQRSMSADARVVLVRHFVFAWQRAVGKRRLHGPPLPLQGASQWLATDDDRIRNEPKPMRSAYCTSRSWIARRGAIPC